MKTLFISITLSVLLFSNVASGQLFVLRPGQSIPVGQNIRAGNGPFTLDMQKDGNLVLYKNAHGMHGEGSFKTPLWATNTDGQTVISCVFQRDGNFVLYASGNRAIWASNTDGQGGMLIQIDNHGQLIMRDGKGKIIWSVPKPVEKSNIADFSKKLSTETPQISTIPLYEVNPDVKAEFTGGNEALKRYLTENLNYPKGAIRASVSGRVFVQFIVESNGKISSIEILKGIGFLCDEEAVRLVSQMPAWKPGQKNGLAVRTINTIPISFALD